MTRRILLLVSLVATAGATPAGAQLAECGLPPGSQPCPVWEAGYGGPGNGTDAATAAVVSPDGARVFVTGGSSGEGSGNDYATIAYDAATGQQFWVARYDNGADDQATAIAVSGDGSRVFVTGRSDGSNVDYGTVAYDAETGQELWAQRLDGPRGLSDFAVAIGVGRTDERVYVTGWSDGGARSSGGTEYDFATVAYDADGGQELWMDRYDGPAGFWDIATDLDVGFEIVEVDGEEEIHDRVYVTGRSNVASTSNDHTDYVTLSYDGASGARLWEAHYDGPSQGREYPYAVTVSDDGLRLYVTGESVGPGSGFDYATVAYDAHTGQQIWASRYAQPFEDRPLGIAATPDRVFVTGFSFNGGHPFDRSVATVAYDATTGQQLWHARRTGPAGEAGRNVMASPDGKRVYVGGLSAGLVFGVHVEALGTALGFSGFLTAAYDAGTGEEVWVAHHGNVAADFVQGATVMDPGGARVFTTGGGLNNYLTVAYDAG